MFFFIAVVESDNVLFRFGVGYLVT